MLKYIAPIAYFVISVLVYVLMQHFVFNTQWDQALVTGGIMGILSTPLYFVFMNYYTEADEAND